LAKVNDKLKESKLKKPEVMTAKRRVNSEEEEKPRKRIRPLLQRETSVETVSNCVPSGPSDAANRIEGAASFPVSRSEAYRLLPSLKVSL
jgi:hypothetical protein